MDKGNKNSASEDSLGKLHGLVSKAYTKRVEHMIELLEEGADADAVIDIRALQAAGKWVEVNGVGCAPMEDDAQSELKQRLDKIRSAQQGNVVKFVREE